MAVRDPGAWDRCRDLATRAKRVCGLARRARNTISMSDGCSAEVAWRERGRSFACHAVLAAMDASQRLGVVLAQGGVGPISALSVAARIVKQCLDLVDPPPILA